MVVTTHSNSNGSTTVTLRDASGRGIDSFSMSPFAFELYLVARESMSDAEAFRLAKEESQVAA